MGEKKNIHCKFTYKCGICGKEFDNVLDRANCEIECVKKAEEAARKAEAEKKAAEQTMRKEAVDEAFENLHRLVTEYVKDYGHYEYGDGGDDTNFYWPTRVWHSLWN
jgi:DNA-directed RNA polymerase subunit RPC12/RpoP